MFSYEKMEGSGRNFAVTCALQDSDFERCGEDTVGSAWIHLAELQCMKLRVGDKHGK